MDMHREYKNLYSLLFGAVIVLALFLLCTNTSYADVVEEGTCGENITWTLDDNGNLVINGEGRTNSYPWFRNKDSIHSVYIGEGITGIASSSFSSCSNLTDVSLPDSLISIGSSAFKGCSKLETIDLPKNLRFINEGTFHDCSSLTEIIIPAKVQELRESFIGCNSLKSITLLCIPEYQTSFVAFSGNIYYPTGSAYWNEEEQLYWAKNANWIEKDFEPVVLESGSYETGVTWELSNLGILQFYGEGEIPDEQRPVVSSGAIVRKGIVSDGITTIGSYAFSHFSRMTSVEIPESVTEIGGYAFYNTGLTEITMPGSVKTIGSATFYYCHNLKEVILNDGIQVIGSRAFDDCRNLEQIALPDTVTTIGFNAFDSCTSLKSIIIPPNATSIGSHAFVRCNGLETVNIKIPAPAYPSNAFTDYSGQIFYPANDKFWDEETRTAWAPNATWIPSEKNNIEIVTIANGECGENAYWSLSNQGVFTVSGEGEMTDCESYKSRPWFEYMSFIKEVIVESGITSIGDLSFEDCKKVQHVELPDSLIVIGRYAFSFTDIRELTIPKGVEKIDSFAFSYTPLEDLHIINSDLFFGWHAFYDCSHLKRIHIDSYTDWCQIGFEKPDYYTNCNPLSDTTAHLVTNEASDSIVLSEGVTTIPYGTFRDNKDLTSIELPKSLKKIEGSAFDGCENLKEIDVHDLNSWCNISFADRMSNPLLASPDTELTLGGGTGSKVALAEGVESIPERTFCSWNRLSEITLPSSIRQVGAAAFAGCDSLRKVNISDLDTWLSIDFETEESSPLTGGKTELRVKNGSRYESLSDVSISRNIGRIPAYAFSGSTTLRTVMIPDSVTKIGKAAFAGCSGLKGVTIPETVTALEELTFSGCRELKKIYIPETVTRIDHHAFHDCAKDLIIYGSEGSEAQIFAEANGITFRPYAEYDSIRTGTITEDIQWILSDGTTLTIISDSGDGIIPDYESGQSPFSGIGDKVTTVKLKGISGIGDYLFEGFSSLKRVDASLDTNITQIGDKAFSGCNDVEIRCYRSSYDNVESIISSDPEFNDITVKKLSGSKIGNVTWTYNDDTGILMLASNSSSSFGADEAFTESPFEDLDVRIVEFSDSFSCKDIPDGLFSGCGTVTEIHLPESVTTIGERAFKDCTRLKELTWYSSITTLGEEAFDGCVNLNRIRISDSMMLDKDQHEAVDAAAEIPENVKHIPDRCFRGCSLLSRIDWYEEPGDTEVTGSVGVEAFRDCRAVNDIFIPEHVGAISAGAFKNCSSIRDLFFGTGVSAIGDEAFYGCTALQLIEFEGDVQDIGSKAIGYHKDENGNTVKLGLVVQAPDSASSVKNYCDENEIRFVTTDGIDDSHAEEQVYVNLYQSSVSVKVGKRVTVGFSTNGKVKRVSSSSANGKVSVSRSGNKIRFKGKSAGTDSVRLSFSMKGGRSITKYVSVRVRKSSASLNDGDEQKITVDKSSLIFAGDTAASQKIKVNGAVTGLECTPSKDGIVKVSIEDNSVVKVTPVKSGNVTLTLSAPADDVNMASNTITIDVKVKARPKRVTAKVKKLSKKRARVSWKKIEGASSYQIQVAQKKSFAGKKTYNVKAKTLKKNVVIKKGKINYIRVRYKFKGKYSKWSKVLTIKK